MDDMVPLFSIPVNRLGKVRAGVSKTKAAEIADLNERCNACLNLGKFEICATCETEVERNARIAADAAEQRSRKQKE